MDPMICELIERVVMRPRMYYGEVKTLRELMAFVMGICCGSHPLFGGDCLGDFPDYVRDRFDRPFNERWHITLLREFEGLEFYAACEAFGGIIRDWKATRR